MPRVFWPRAAGPGLVIVSLLMVSGSARAQQVFEPLPMWSWATYSSATAISGDGRAVVGEMGSSTLRRAFVWTRSDGLIDLSTLSPGAASVAADVSSDGGVVVGTSANRAFRWTLSGMMSLGTLPGGTSSAATGVSADGSVVVGWSDTPNGIRAFRWTLLTGMTDLGVLPGGAFSLAQAVSSDGQTIVGFSDFMTMGPHAIRWRFGHPMQDLGAIPGGNYTQAFAVSRDGAWVVGEGNAPGGTRTFRWAGHTGIVNLGGLPTSNSAGARAVSDDGRVIVGYSDTNTSLNATIWTPEAGLIDLRQQLIDFGAVLDGWTLVAASGASEDGRSIVGTAASPEGQRAWIARLPVLPCAANCDSSITSPILNGADFMCFFNHFITGDSAANCDGSTVAPILNAMDFHCFMQKFASGCP